MKNELSAALSKFFEKYGKKFEEEDLQKFDELWKKFYDSVDDDYDIWSQGGGHYQQYPIQPAQFINKNKLLFAEGNVIKYVCRHKMKGKESDIRKAMHYLKMIIERDYD